MINSDKTIQPMISRARRCCGLEPALNAVFWVLACGLIFCFNFEP